MQMNQSRYGDIAKQSSNIQQHGKEEKITRAFCYSVEDLDALSEKTDLGLSCGNPVGFANVKEAFSLQRPELIVERVWSNCWKKKKT